MQTSQRARTLLITLGADSIAHPGGTLLAHLERTSALLRSWGADEPLVSAGLCHAAYGTAGFPMPLLPLDRRGELAELIGEQAEAIVYTYCSCDRRYGLPRIAGHDDLLDRFTGVRWTPAPTMARQLAELTAANELDLCMHGELELATRAKVLAYVRSCRPLVSAAAASALDMQG